MNRFIWEVCGLNSSKTVRIYATPCDSDLLICGLFNHYRQNSNNTHKYKILYIRNEWILRFKNWAINATTTYNIFIWLCANEIPTLICITCCVYKHNWFVSSMQAWYKSITAIFAYFREFLAVTKRNWNNLPIFFKLRIENNNIVNRNSSKINNNRNWDFPIAFMKISSKPCCFPPSNSYTYTYKHQE